MELSIFWAIKEIPLSRKREALLLKKLQHPSIPKMVDFVQTQEACFLVMEYIRGQSLEDLLKKGTRFSRGRLLDLALTVTDILIYLHGLSPPILYGDLKPANLMLTDTGKLYLVDLGSAIALWPGEAPCALEGTKDFASPEQYQGRIYPQSDLYCLGKTLQALGRGHLSPGLSRFALICTRQEVSRRYQSARQAKEALLSLKRKGHLLPYLFASLLGGLFFSSLFLFSTGRLSSQGMPPIPPLSSPPLENPSLTPPARPSAPLSLPTSAPTSTNTPVPTSTNTPVPTCTNTPVPTSTSTPVPTSTDTPVPTCTNTPPPTCTSTPVPTSTDTPCPARQQETTQELLSLCLEEVIWQRAKEDSAREGEAISLSLSKEQARKVKKSLLGYLAKASTKEERLNCLSLLASFAQLSGSPQEAVSFLEQTLSLQEDGSLRATLGLLYLRLGQRQESLSLYEEKEKEPAWLLPSHEETLWRERLFH